MVLLGRFAFVTNRTTISGADERIHPVEETSPRWSDAVSFSAWDDASGLFLIVRAAVLPNQPGATAAVVGWVGARPVYAYAHALDVVPLADWDDLAVAGLRVQELEALRSWEVNLGDGDNGVSLRWDGFSAVHSYDGLPTAVALGHYEQSCHVTGQADLNGHLVRVDGAGQRSHTWGVRDPDAVTSWRAVTAFLGASSREKGTAATDRAVHLWEVVGRDGATTVDGYVHDGGEDLRVVRVTDARGDDLALDVTVEGGRRFTLRGTGHGGDVPVRPAGAGADSGAVLHQQLVRWESEDGLDGYGIVEVLAHAADAASDRS